MTKESILLIHLKFFIEKNINTWYKQILNDKILILGIKFEKHQ